MSGVEVELVHLDDCPLWRGAAARVREAMRIAGLDPAILRYRGVETVHAAGDFPGSPTILIEGRDPFASGIPAGPTCRRYPTAQGLDVAPPLEQLVEALVAESVRGGSRSAPRRPGRRPVGSG